MKPYLTRFSKLSSKWLWPAIGVLVIVVGLATLPLWLPVLNVLADTLAGRSEVAAAEGSEDDHAGHDHAADAHEGHDHAGHDESQSLELSAQARKNIGLRVGEVRLTNYARSITVPALVTGRPGKTHQKVAAPLTGVVTGVHVVEGEVVNSGDLLFNLRLTHEDLVQAQTEFLTSLGQLDVEKRELKRLENISSGVVAQKVILERQYEVDKLEAVLKAQRHALHLHGLADEQVDDIVRNRNLVREMQVLVPYLHEDSSVHDKGETPRRISTISTAGATSTPTDDLDGREFPRRLGINTASATSTSTDGHEVRSQRFVVRELGVQTGEAVQTGQTLCILTDYSTLYVEGRAFEQDAAEIIQAANDERRITAFPEQAGLGSPSGLEELEIVYVSNEIERDSRALHFYVNLPNEIVRESQRDNHQFVTWRFKPGQRMQLRVPVEQWENVMVLPVDAVAQEGPETFVFVENGDHFDRRPVHIKYRDQYDAVIDNDGSLFPGESVAQNGAHQLQMAIKNKSGGAVDPHAGHNH